MEFQEDERNKKLFQILEQGIDDDSILNEINVKEGENLNTKQTKILIEKAENSVCEIIENNGYASGFFCKIRYPDEFNEITCLFTNNHVINEKILFNENNYIKIKIRGEEKKIFLNYYRKMWTNKDLDFTCIEIIKQDNIFELINTFEIDKNCYNINFDTKEYDKRGLVITSVANNKEIELSQGVLFYYNINNNKLYFFHNCSTTPGFSGGPVILINMFFESDELFRSVHKKFIDVFNEIMLNYNDDKLLIDDNNNNDNNINQYMKIPVVISRTYLIFSKNARNCKFDKCLIFSKKINNYFNDKVFKFFFKNCEIGAKSGKDSYSTDENFYEAFLYGYKIFNILSKIFQNSLPKFNLIEFINLNPFQRLLLQKDCNKYKFEVELPIYE